MTRPRRSPRPLAGPLAGLAEQLAPLTILAEVQSAWREAVGPMIAERAWPVAARGGALTVSCESSVWAQELDLMSESICQRLNARLNRAEIVKLRCLASPPQPPSQTEAPRG